jgi:hypothetical protein
MWICGWVTDLLQTFRLLPSIFIYSLGPLVNKVKEFQVETIVDTLCSNMISDKEQLRDISSIGKWQVERNRFVVVFMPPSLDEGYMKFYPLLYVHPSVCPTFGFYLITCITFFEIIWNLFTRLVTIKGRPFSDFRLYHLIYCLELSSWFAEKYLFSLAGRGGINDHGYVFF